MSSGSTANRFQKRRVATEFTYVAATREGGSEWIHALLPRTGNRVCLLWNPDPFAHPSAFAVEHGTIGQGAGTRAAAIPGLRPRSLQRDPYSESSTGPPQRSINPFPGRSNTPPWWRPIARRASYRNFRYPGPPANAATR